MSKRKLSKQQASRAAQSSEKKLARSQRKERDLTRKIQSGEYSSEQLGLVICRYSKQFEIEALEGEDKQQVHQCVARTSCQSLVAGDKVVWRSGSSLTGVVESRIERSSLLERPDNFGKLKPVAANIDQMLIVIAAQPEPQPNLIDRYLVAAHLSGIAPIIVVNKADLINDTNRASLDSMLTIFTDLGYQVVRITSSRHQTPELANLPELIKNRTSIVVGQSGVGKSSLINTILPAAQLRIGELSSNTGEGTHTTTMAKLFHLPDGGQLIDSPGIRDFALWHIDEQELQQGFREINAITGECRFRNCQHENEPGCAVHIAANEGRIHAKRFNSFLRIRDSIKERQS